MKTSLLEESSTQIVYVVPAKFYSVFYIHTVIDKDLNNLCLFSNNAVAAEYIMDSTKVSANHPISVLHSAIYEPKLLYFVYISVPIRNLLAYF